MIIITGAAGQLGSDVVSELRHRKIDYMGIDKRNVDITDKEAVRSFLILHKPSGIIHCAAYTAVDAAEEDVDLCMRVNAGGTENIANACREINAKMLYISTDYVFDGQGNMPYETDSPKGPLSVYGRSKLDGEEAVLRCLDKYYIVRISWAFGNSGTNFVKTMLRIAQTKDEINVVSDQIGSPTYTRDLATLLCDMVLSEQYGIYHATNEGFCSWAEFASEIMKLSGSPCKINPVPSEQYPTKAVRPQNSRLSKSSLDIAEFKRLPSWQESLSSYLTELQRIGEH